MAQTTLSTLAPRTIPRVSDVSLLYSSPGLEAKWCISRKGTTIYHVLWPNLTLSIFTIKPWLIYVPLPNVSNRYGLFSKSASKMGYFFLIDNKSTLDNSPPPNYDKESKDECHHVNNNPRYKWHVKPAAFQVIAPTRSNYGRKINVKNRNKSTILIFLPAIIELVQELLISNMHNKLEEDTCENVEVIAPTRSNYWRKMRKITINRPFFLFFQPLLNLSKNYL